MNSLDFLIRTIFDLYIMVVLLRVWLQWARADFYNPFSQAIVKATQPVVAPLRRIIPAVGGLDLATLLFAYALTLAKFMLLIFSGTGVFVFGTEYFFFALISLIKAAGGLLFWVLILRAILSWVSQGSSSVEYVMYQLTEPLLAPIRRFIPPLGGLDLSVLILFIVLQFLNYFIGDLVGDIWFRI